MIKLKGPISIADYMADALGHPHDGYYNSATSIGADGDFTTAPEISQIFGELIGAWLVQSWITMGEPTNFNLVELGPGRGVLMADILRTAQIRPAFAKAVDVWLLEASGRLRHEQQKRLRGFDTRMHWADQFDDIPDAPTLIIANEFFDCLPIRQFQRTGTTWRERLIGLNPHNDGLDFVLAQTPAAPDLPIPAHLTKKADQKEGPQDGDIFEFSEDAQQFMKKINKLIRDNGGRALIIDYGHLASGLGDTFQAVKAHRYCPPLSTPGKADVTAHVDFDALARIALEDGMQVDGPVTQGSFLERLGLPLRVDALSKSASEKTAQTIHAGAHRISSPAQMGEIFKVLCVGSPNLSAPPGFS